MSHPKLECFKYPTLTSYDWTRDPKNYILNFQTLMVFYVEKYHILCKTFATNLCGFAITSFTNLPPYSIISFHDFAKKFIVTFITRVPTKQMSTHLFSVTHAPSKTLRDYITRFNNETLPIQEL